jgi:hypothetical protein
MALVAKVTLQHGKRAAMFTTLGSRAACRCMRPRRRSVCRWS